MRACFYYPSLPGPQGAAMKQQLKEVETQAMIQDAATIARKVIKETMDDSKPTSGVHLEVRIMILAEDAM